MSYLLYLYSNAAATIGHWILAYALNELSPAL